jgi:hypothetical protein
MEVAIPGKGMIDVKPILARRSLAELLGAENLPPPPLEVPKEAVEVPEEAAARPDTVAMPAAPVGASERARAWMRGYACGLKEAERKPKREPTINLCMSETGATYRQAEEAWGALPADWKNPPRIAKD